MKIVDCKLPALAFPCAVGNPWSLTCYNRAQKNHTTLWVKLQAYEAKLLHMVVGNTTHVELCKATDLNMDV